LPEVRHVRVHDGLQLGMSINRSFYSVRTGRNKNANGFPLETILELFQRLYRDLRHEGYFDQYLGSYCVDLGNVGGLIKTLDLDILLKLRKQGLWPVDEVCQSYSEDDLLDVIEYLFTVVSKPIDGSMHAYSNCGMHWETFNKKEGEAVFRERINELLAMYKNRFELSATGEVLQRPEPGFEKMFASDMPTNDKNVRARIDSATLQFRRHAATIDDRRQAVRDLADVLEYLRPQMRAAIDTQDEAALFNIANNFAIRHHNERQKTAYDAALWLSWMFYVYLATIHVILRKIGDGQPAPVAAAAASPA
jgi:hypothetical protein